jgi:hypothetical protein
MLLLLAELPQLLSDSWCWCLVSEPHIWIWKPLHLGNSTHQAVYPTSHDIPIWYSKMIQCAPWYYQIIISSTYVISVFEHSLPSSPGTSSLPRTSMKASRWFSMRSQGCKEVCGWMWNQARTFVKSCKILMRQTQGWPKRNTSSWFKKKNTELIHCWPYHMMPHYTTVLAYENKTFKSVQCRPLGSPYTQLSARKMVAMNWQDLRLARAFSFNRPSDWEKPNVQGCHGQVGMNMDEPVMVMPPSKPSNWQFLFVGHNSI